MVRLMSKAANVLVIALAVTTMLSGCGSKSKLTVDTVVGEVNASDYYNWQDFEEDAINKVKLDSEEKKEIDDMVAPIENGTAPDGDIEEIKNTYGSVKEYRKALERDAKCSKLRREAYKDVEVTDEDREQFISRYSNTFAGMNALVFQFDNESIAQEFESANRGQSREDVLKYIGDKAGESDITWDKIEEIKDKTGISLLHNADSDKYNYCESDTLKSEFESIADGQMSGVFTYGDKPTVMIRVSNNTVEKDDALVDNYMLKIKKDEAYKKYIVEHK